MEERDFELDMLLAKGMAVAESENERFWRGYTRGLQRGYYGEKFGTAEEHKAFWALADHNAIDVQEVGDGYRAGFRHATLDPNYCSQIDFRCEYCSRVKYNLDCHNNPIDGE